MILPETYPAMPDGTNQAYSPSYVVEHFAHDFAPCECVTHVAWSVPCTRVYQIFDVAPTRRTTVFLGWYTRTCLNCGATWTTTPRTNMNSDFRFLWRKIGNHNHTGDDR